MIDGNNKESDKIMKEYRRKNYSGNSYSNNSYYVDDYSKNEIKWFYSNIFKKLITNFKFKKYRATKEMNIFFKILYYILDFFILFGIIEL